MPADHNGSIANEIVKSWNKQKQDVNKSVSTHSWISKKEGLNFIPKKERKLCIIFEMKYRWNQADADLPYLNEVTNRRLMSCREI